MRVPAIENVRCNERLFWKSAAIRLLGFYVMVGRSYGVEFCKYHTNRGSSPVV